MLLFALPQTKLSGAEGGTAHPVKKSYKKKKPNSAEENADGGNALDASFDNDAIIWVLFIYINIFDVVFLWQINL